MAKEQGWWELKITRDRLDVEPSEADLEHIAELIKAGFTQGEIVINENEDEFNKRMEKETIEAYQREQEEDCPP